MAQNDLTFSKRKVPVYSRDNQDDINKIDDELKKVGLLEDGMSNRDKRNVIAMLRMSEETAAQDEVRRNVSFNDENLETAEISNQSYAGATNSNIKQYPRDEYDIDSDSPPDLSTRVCDSYDVTILPKKFSNLSRRRRSLKKTIMPNSPSLDSTPGKIKTERSGGRIFKEIDSASSSKNCEMKLEKQTTLLKQNSPFNTSLRTPLRNNTPVKKFFTAPSFTPGRSFTPGKTSASKFGKTSSLFEKTSSDSGKTSSASGKTSSLFGKTFSESGKTSSASGKGIPKNNHEDFRNTAETSERTLKIANSRILASQKCKRSGLFHCPDGLDPKKHTAIIMGQLEALNLRIYKYQRSLPKFAVWRKPIQAVPMSVSDIQALKKSLYKEEPMSVDNEDDNTMSLPDLEIEHLSDSQDDFVSNKATTKRLFSGVAKTDSNKGWLNKTKPNSKNELDESRETTNNAKKSKLRSMSKKIDLAFEGSANYDTLFIRGINEKDIENNPKDPTLMLIGEETKSNERFKRKTRSVVASTINLSDPESDFDIPFEQSTVNKSKIPERKKKKNLKQETFKFYCSKNNRK